MGYNIKKIGVIGSGVMGARLAALFAGVGVRVELLDIVPQLPLSLPAEKNDTRFRNRLAEDAVSKLLKAKPPAFYAVEDAKLIRPGNLEDHINRLSECDWILEAVVERLDIKKTIYSKLIRIAKSDTLISSNTSSILRRDLIQGLPESFAKRFLITHFFNPPRYMKLLEIVGEGADENAALSLHAFAEEVLGKGVVRAKDTPGFIANRIGVFYVLDVMHQMARHGWPIEAVDAVLGKATGRPKSGVFRTMDMAGLDTLAFVATELVKSLPAGDEIQRLKIPQFLQHMIVGGQTGDKSGRGFYFKDKATGQILSYDPFKQDYRTKVGFSTPSLSDSLEISDVRERIKRIVFSEDQSGEIAWPAISRVLVYTANLVPDVSEDIAAMDNAMKWGYHWELGPFETWDALGVKEVVERLEKDGVEIPKIVSDLLGSGGSFFCGWRGFVRTYFDVSKKKMEPAQGSDKSVTLKRIKECGGKILGNQGATLLDLGDGIFACEFHTKMNAIDGDVVSVLNLSLDRVEKDGLGLLVYNDAENFSAGANLLLILMAAEQKRWGEIDAMVGEFQAVNQRMRFSAKPVMAVPFGMTLGGGCEICLACNLRTASIETYMGLVEVGTGLVPAGGGCKNFVLKLEKNIRAGGPQPKVSAAFELIATARVSTSAKNALALGLLSEDDRVVMDRERLLNEAKNTLLVAAGDYLPRTPRTDILLPGIGGEMALVNALRNFVALGKATEYDAFICRKLAHVLAGGDFPVVHETTEEHILDLEREAFLSLVGEQRTKERMISLLKTGKPLRN